MVHNLGYLTKTIGLKIFNLKVCMNFGVQPHSSVQQGHLHHMDINKFLKNLLLRDRCSDFEIISQNVPWVTVFKNCLRNFDTSRNMALVNGATAVYGHEEVHKKNHL